MDPAMNGEPHFGFRRARQNGFTIVEVLCSMVIVAIGLVTLLAAFATALAATQSTQEDQIARHEAAEALENIFTARDTAQVSFAMIQNVSNGGIFLDGFQPITSPGPDGLDGTADDVAPSPVMLSGPDGILGTPDDVPFSLTNYQRRIQVLPVNNPDGTVNPNLRQIMVTLRYTAPRFQLRQRDYVVGGYISSYR
jgi:prepilin-type N-terminal cleavage/methylation domain-containing protein